MEWEKLLKLNKMYQFALRLTADKRLCYASPKLPSATSFSRKTLYATGLQDALTLRIKSGDKLWQM